MPIPEIDGFSTFKLPLQNIPQIFEISLAGVDYLMTVKWNDAFEAGWQIDLADVTTNTSIVAGLPLIVGADVLSGLEYLGIEGRLIVFTDGDENAVPTLDNLGVESNLYFLTQAPNG